MDSIHEESADSSNAIEDYFLPDSSKANENHPLPEDVVEYNPIRHDRAPSGLEDTSSQASACILWRVEPFGKTGKTLYVEGPAVSYNLRQRNSTSSAGHLFYRSVVCSKEGDLKSLLVLHGSRFAEWRKYYFLEACRQGKTDLVQVLLENGEDIDHEHDGLTGPQLATIGGHINVVERFLLWGSNNNVGIIERHSLLHAAVMSDKVALTHFLITQGAKVYHRDKDGVQSIHLACLRGHLESIKNLLLVGAHVDCLDFEGHQPLHYLGHPESSDGKDILEILHLLLVAGASIDTETTIGNTLLEIACRNRKTNTLRALLLFGASLHSSIVRESPLHAACRKGNTAVVQILLKHSIAFDVCVVTTGEESPLSLAISNGDGKIVRMLLAKAVDLEVSGEETIKPICRACEKHDLWVAPQLKEKMLSGKSLIVGDLLARGPLLSPTTRYLSRNVFPWSHDSKCDILLGSDIPLRSDIFSAGLISQIQQDTEAPSTSSAAHNPRAVNVIEKLFNTRL